MKLWAVDWGAPFVVVSIVFVMSLRSALWGGVAVQLQRVLRTQLLEASVIA